MMPKEKREAMTGEEMREIVVEAANKALDWKRAGLIAALTSPAFKAKMPASKEESPNTPSVAKENL
jgi:hypothetical protein